MLHFPTPMLLGDQDPYPKWLAYVNAITAANSTDPNADSAEVGPAIGAGLKRFTFPAVPAGTMYGTCIGSEGLGAYTRDSNFTRIAQHAFGSLQNMNDNKGKVVLLQVLLVGEAAGFVSRNINEYTSLLYAETYFAGYCERFEYFNPATGRRVFRNPYSGLTQEFDL